MSLIFLLKLAFLPLETPFLPLEIHFFPSSTPLIPAPGELPLQHETLVRNLQSLAPMVRWEECREARVDSTEMDVEWMFNACEW